MNIKKNMAQASISFLLKHLDCKNVCTDFHSFLKESELDISAYTEKKTKLAGLWSELIEHIYYDPMEYPSSYPSQYLDAEEMEELKEFLREESDSPQQIVPNEKSAREIVKFILKHIPHKKVCRDFHTFLRNAGIDIQPFFREEQKDEVFTAYKQILNHCLTESSQAPGERDLEILRKFVFGEI